MNTLMATIHFESSRVMTAGRITWWFVLAAFPILITGLIRFFALAESTDAESPLPDPTAAVDADLAISDAADDDFPLSDPTDPDVDTHQFWAWAIYVLVPCITCAMGVLLSAGPSIATELEQRSWAYMATRPNGIFWLMLGKYAVALGWATSAAVAGLSISVLFSMQPTAGRIWISCIALSALSAMSYAAVFMLIGTIFPQRAMLFCVAWTAVVEGFVSLIPAIINRITVQYRLRSLFIDWTQPGGEFSDIPMFSRVIAPGGWYVQVIWLVMLTLLFLSAAITIAHRREFTAASESEV